MLKSISWREFEFVLAMVVGLYYVVVALVLYKRRITKLFFKDKEHDRQFIGLEGGVAVAADPVQSDSPETAPLEMAHRASGSPETDLYPLANELLESINDFILDASRRKPVKEEILFGLQLIIAKYPLLQLAGYKVAINNYIGTALKNSFALSLEDQELDILWPRANV